MVKKKVVKEEKDVEKDLKNTPNGEKHCEAEKKKRGQRKDSIIPSERGAAEEKESRR